MMEKENEPSSANDPPYKAEGNGGDPKTFSTAAAGTVNQQIYPEQSGQQSGKTQRGEFPLKLLGAWRFISEPRHSNAVVAIFTLLLFFTTAIYTLFSALQWKAMRETLGEMRDQDQSQGRAILIIDRSLLALESGQLGIRIVNQGHRAATVIKYKLEYWQIMLHTNSIVRNFEARPNQIVSVENPYIISVKLPPVPANVPPQQGIRLQVRILYNDGFGEIQRVTACFSPEIFAQNQWNASCMWVDNADLSKPFPNDVVVPPNEKGEHKKQH